jgi:citrate lyase subunit beta/citryl-CoA lyase
MPQALRSLLFVPADDERKMRRAIQSAADLVIFDLEDSVAAQRKIKARQTLCALLAEQRPACFAIRVNAQDTEHHLDDLLVVARLSPDFLMLPKCASAADLVPLDAQLQVLERANDLPLGRIRLLPLVTETATAIAGLDYRAAPARLAALVFAAEDLSADLGVAARGADGVLHPLIRDARLRVAWAAAQARLPALDTPHPDPRDLDGLARETAAAVELGYVGKLCIHPGQIEVVHRGLSPTDDRLSWAHAVTAAFAQDPSVGVTLVEGRMVDKAHLRLARKLLAMGGTDG